MKSLKLMDLILKNLDGMQNAKTELSIMKSENEIINFRLCRLEEN